MFGFHHIDSGDFQIVWISRKFFLSRPTVGTIQSNPGLRLLTSSSHLFNVRDGGDQEEDAGDEGGEGQRLRQGRRL